MNSGSSVNSMGCIPRAAGMTEGKEPGRAQQVPSLPRRGLVIKERNVGMCVARCTLDVNGEVCLSLPGCETDRMR